MNNFNPGSKTSQNGSVLIISITFLVLLTLITFPVAENSILQEKMTSQNRDSALALQVAESALVEAEGRANTQDYTIDGGNDGFYDGNCDIDVPDCYLNTLTDFFDDNTWVKSSDAVTPISCGNEDPACTLTGKYIIIKLGKADLTSSGAKRVVSFTNQYQDQNEGAIGDIFVYRIIAQGTGINPNNKRVLVTHFAASEE